MPKEAKDIITTVCDEQYTLSDHLLPKHCAPMIAQVVNEKKLEKAPKKMELEKPGYESYRKTREDRTTMDKLHMALTELCFAINYCATIRCGRQGTLRARDWAREAAGPGSGRDQDQDGTPGPGQDQRPRRPETR